MKKKNSFMIFVVIFALTIGFVFCSGYFRKSLSMEAGKFNLDLPVYSEAYNLQPVVLDIQDRGVQKKVTQSGVVSFVIGQGSAITNNDIEPLLIKVNTMGFSEKVKIESQATAFDDVTHCFKEELLPGKSYSVNINLEIPQNCLNNYDLGAGCIEFMDAKKNKLLGKVPIKIINSLRKPCCPTASVCNEM